MILKVNGSYGKSAGRFLQVTPDGDIILTFDVVGSYFPARTAPNLTTAISLRSQDNVSNKLYIDYSDGTGEHIIDFKSTGSIRAINFGANANATTPATITTQGSLNVSSLHFYQDLPAGVKDTVNDSYMLNGQTRKIKIRFQKPQSITQITVNRVYFYNQLPSALSKLSNLQILSLSNINYITSFPQDFINSQIKELTLSGVGDIMNSGFPFWILNSPLNSLSLASSIDLSGSPVAKRFTQINSLKNTLTYLNLSTANINYTMPQELTELYKLTAFIASVNTSPDLRFPVDLSGFVALQNIDLNRTAMPWSEYERIMQGIPSLRTVTIPNLAFTTDQDFQAVNTYITAIQIGGTTWNNGAVPSFINKLVGLKTLTLRQLSGNLGVSFNNYGNFSACTELTTLDMSRITTMPTTIPAWFIGLIKLKTILAPAVFGTITRVNDFVNNVYTFITANAQILGASSLQFRGMTIDIYGSSSNDTPNSVRPSGIYQQPAGYVQGVSNGMPASAMEKIWVLEKQYAHYWNYKPL
jgi:hypothetical protein